ncbi:DUF6318 family protein [Terrabacter sp. BE26]|uniref:DUF6318 family protein n=1 Tax=Terrabacter sp. BE26 TaxID=2898152 RepID=UPI0035BE4AD6
MIAKIPAAARTVTGAGAQAFARFFIESLNKGATKPDATALSGLFAPECKTCVAMDKSLQKLKAQGERHAATSIVVTRTNSLTFRTSSAQVLIDVEQKRVKVLNSEGSALRETASGPGTFVMTLSQQGGHWVATKLQTAS